MAPRLLPSNDPARAPTDVFYDLQLLFPTALSAKTRGATLIPIKYLQLSKQCAAGAWAPRGRQARPTEPLSLDSRCDSTRLQCPVENDTGPRHGAVPEAVGPCPRLWGCHRVPQGSVSSQNSAGGIPGGLAPIPAQPPWFWGAFGPPAVPLSSPSSSSLPASARGAVGSRSVAASWELSKGLPAAPRGAERHGEGTAGSPRPCPADKRGRARRKEALGPCKELGAEPAPGRPPGLSCPCCTWVLQRLHGSALSEPPSPCCGVPLVCGGHGKIPPVPA